MRRTLLFLFSLTLLLCLLPQTAGAVRAVPVTVDGVVISGSSLLSDGVTRTPLRYLCEALGGWQVFWDGETRTAWGIQSGHTIAASTVTGQVTVDGVHAGSGVFLQDGRTYIPLRAVCEALDLTVCWDSRLDGAAVTTTATAFSLREDDLYWLSRIISAESRGESLEGQMAVGSVILNRVQSPDFPDTIQEVIFDARDAIQFEPVENGTIYDDPTPLSVAAAEAVLAGSNPVGGCLYFYDPALSQGLWINANRTYWTTIGCHRFYL